MIEYSTKTKLVFKILGMFIAVVFGVVGFIVVQKYSNNLQGRDLPNINCPAQDVCVSLKEDRAEPDILTVPIGTFVRFNSKDGKSHSLSLGKGGEEHEHTGRFTSGEFKADEAWRVQFQEPGTYVFHDHFSPTIVISVVVYKPGSSYKLE